MVRRALFCVAFLLAGVPSADAADLPRQDFKVEWQGGAPRVSFSAAGIVDDQVQRKLASGLQQRFVITVNAHIEGSGSEVAARQFLCSVTWNIWDEAYVVRLGAREYRETVRKAALSRCLDVSDLIVGHRKHYERHRGKRVYFEVLAEFNPISNERCRQLVRSGAHDDPIGPVVLNIVRRRVCAADHTIEFRSKPFDVAPRSVPP